MTDTEKRVAIAEGCGWRFVDQEPECHHGSGKVPWGQGQRTSGKRWDPPEGVTSSNAWQFNAADALTISSIPDYLKDLNAIQEAVLSLNKEQAQLFLTALDFVISGRLPEVASRRNALEFSRVNATCQQRSDAFLKAIRKL